MENSLKILILAASLSITCMVVSLGFYTGREAKAISEKAIERINGVEKDLEEDQYVRFDGLVVMGSDVINFIQKHLSYYSPTEFAPIYVFVNTKNSSKTYVNNIHIKDIKNYESEYYVNPLGKFNGKVIRDLNDVIQGVSFVSE